MLAAPATGAALSHPGVPFCGLPGPAGETGTPTVGDLRRLAGSASTGGVFPRRLAAAEVEARPRSSAPPSRDSRHALPTVVAVRLGRLGSCSLFFLVISGV